MEVEGLAGICAGLGCASQDTGACYIKSDHCLENLKNLQRFLRRDHPTRRPVFKLLGKWNTVGQDLVPIIVQYRDDPELVINAVKVVVFLTMPVDEMSDDISLQRGLVWNFKSGFLDNDAIAVIVSLLEDPLEHLESGIFAEDDWKVVQLVLTLVRNLLDIQDPPSQKDSSTVVAIRDKLLQHLFQENVMDLLLALAHHATGSHGPLRQDRLLFLEIFHHIFWGQSPEKVAGAHVNDYKDKKTKPSSGLLRTMMEEEKEQLKIFRLQDLPRHSRFSGTFMRVAEDGSKKMLKRNPFQSPIETVLRAPRFKHGPVKRIACDRNYFSTSEGKALVVLKTFADQILEGAYNVVMQSVKDDIRRERNGIQSADVTIFFRVAKFFTAYQRYKVSDSKGKSGSKDFRNLPGSEKEELFQGHLCGPIASTMDEDMFEMVISQWHAFSESAKETNDWIPLFVTGTLVKEMIRMLDLVLKLGKVSSEEVDQEVRVARILLYKVFYDQTEKGIMQFLQHLLKSFDFHKQPRSHLADLVETVHVMLRLLEHLTNAEGSLRVLKKSKKPNRNKAKAKDTEVDQAQSKGGFLNPPAESFAEIGVPPSLNNVPSSEVIGQEEQSGDIPMADVAAEHSDIVKPVKECTEDIRGFVEGINGKPTPMELNQPLSEDEGDQTRGLDEEEDSECYHTNHCKEVSLDVQKCAFIYADNTVIRNYCWLLKYYDSNSVATNYYIICMLQRVCKDYFLEPMLFQLSVLQIFYEILSNRKASESEEHKPLFTFLRKLVRNLFKKLKVQPLLFLDMLFWKTRLECHLISNDYEIQTLKRVAGKSSKSTCKNKAIADALGNDEFDVDCPPFELSEEELEEKGGVQCLFKTSNSLKALRRRKGDLFSVKQEAQVKELFEQYKKDRKCCHLLAQAIDSEGKITAAQVRRKLKLFGLSPPGERSKPRNQTLKGRDSTDATSSEHTKEQGNTKPAVRRKKRAVETLSSSDQLKDQSKTKRAVKRKKRVVETVATDTQDSDNETLTQMMEKMQQNNGGIAETRENILATNPLVKANENKATKRKELKSSRKMEPASEQPPSEDETLQDLINRRVIKRRRRTICKVGGSDMLLQSSDHPSLFDEEDEDDEHSSQHHRHRETRRRNLLAVADEEE